LGGACSELICILGAARSSAVSWLPEVVNWIVLFIMAAPHPSPLILANNNSINNTNNISDITPLPASLLKSQWCCRLLHSNSFSAVEIIQSRSIIGRQQEYYIHFIDLNRRLDRWVNEDELIPIQQSSNSSLILQSPVAKSLLPPAELLMSSPILHPQQQSPISSPIITSNPLNTSEKRLTRRDKRKLEGNSEAEEGLLDLNCSLHVDSTELELEREHEEKTKVKNINTVIVGQYELECWYYSPFPHKYRYEPILYLCDWCLKYCTRRNTLEEHSLMCRYRHPPGSEIYRDGQLSVFEVDGDKHRIYCQNLSLFSKLFIDHKTAYYDVEPFLFYILTEYTPKVGYRVVGYFSKEKHSLEHNNVACILTFPQYQRRGYGKFLISLSYALSKIEGKIGSPEKPLSDLGRVSYKSYWTEVLIKFLSSMSHSSTQSGIVTIPVQEVSVITCIKPADIISTLRALELIRYVKGAYLITCNPKIIETIQTSIIERESKNSYQSFDPNQLQWTPPLFPRELKQKKFSATKNHSTNNVTTHVSLSSTV
jgi:histone acetyltransferase MYST1